MHARETKGPARPQTAVCACDDCLARVRDEARERVLARSDILREETRRPRGGYGGGGSGHGGRIVDAGTRKRKSRTKTTAAKGALCASRHEALFRPGSAPAPAGKVTLQRSFLVSSKAARRRLGRNDVPGPDKRLRELERIFGLAEQRGLTRGKLKARQPSSVATNRALRRSRRMEKLGERRFAATEAQRVWRGHRDRVRTQKLVRRVCAAQALVRGHLQRRSGQLEVLRQEKDAATRMQALARRRLATRTAQGRRQALAKARHEATVRRQNMERQSATSLQATWRASVTRHDYVARRSSVITVQSVFRRRCASREVAVKRETLRRRTIAAVQIQRNVRGHNVRAALRTAKEDAAARVIEKLMRWYMNRAQLRLHRLRKDNLRNIWHDLAQESSGEAGISSLLRDYPMFDRNEAAVHAALFAAFARRNFDEAVDLVQSHAAEGDPRARYLRALAMRLGGRGAPATLIQIVGRGKQLELDERLREERVTPRVFFGPGRTTALPCMEELEFLLRLAVQMATDPHERAKRICVLGVFRHLIVKDTDGAERMLLEAATLTPEDPFVTMCFYGRAAAPDEPLPSPGLCEEDFAGSGALCVLVRHGLQIRDFDGVRVAVLERRSKHGRVDLMFSLSLQSLSLTEEKGHEKEGGDSGRESEGMARKTLIVTHSQLREWASFLDQPDALNASADPKRALALYEELVDSLDIVRTDREEATWNSVQPALRFKQRPVGTRVQLTRNRHLLSLTFFLEEQQRLRITAYCAALDDTFAVVLGKTQIEALCIDSPLLNRMFAERGWRRATHFSPLLDRVAGLLEVCDPPPETPRYLSYTRSDQMLVNNRIVKRPFKQQYNSLGLTSGKYLKISGLEDAMRAARRNWAAERIQSLFHLQRAYDAYYAAVLDRAAVGLQRLWRGHCARLANASHRAEARRHRAASRLAAFGHGIRQRKALRSRIRHVVGDAASGDWHAYWCAAAVQRRCGGALYASIFTSDLDADVNVEGLRVCNGDFALARELYFERALRMQPEAPRPCIAYALATMEFTDDYEEALRLLARAEALGPVHPKFHDWLASRQRIRAEAVVKVQRMWRFTRNLPRYSFLLATEMACAQRAIDLGVATVDDWESHVFGLQALHCDEVAANDVYERTLLRKFPGRASFRLGHAVLHRLDSVDAHPPRSDLGGILRYFRHACLAQDPQKLAPALANLALLYWYLNVCDEAESLVRRALNLAPDCSAALEVFYVFRRASSKQTNGDHTKSTLFDSQSSLSIGNIGLQSAIHEALLRRLRLERLAEKRVKDEILARARECEEMAKHDKPPPSMAKQRTLRESIMTQSQIAEARRKAKQERRRTTKMENKKRIKSKKKKTDHDARDHDSNT